MSYARPFLAALSAAASLVALGALAGCSSDDAAPRPPVLMVDGGPIVPARALTIVGAAGPRTVLFGETLAFSVRYAEADGRPVIGEEVVLGMVGVAHDSSLERTSATTDADGVAHGLLLAGRTRAYFRVRASAVGAAPATFEVAVGDAGFGALRAEVRYPGSRTIAARLVAIYGGATCEDTVTVATPDDERPLVELDSAARFAALPAGLAYAVVARGESESGTLLTRGCVDGVLVESGAETVTVLTMEDVAVTAAGAYDVELDVSVPSAGTALRDATAATVAWLELTGGDPTAILDVIWLDVDDRDATAAEAFAAARRLDSLDAALGNALDAEGTRPSAALTALANVVGGGLSALRVTGQLELDPRGVAAPDAFRNVTVWSLALGPAPTEIAALGPTGAPTVLSIVGFSPARSLLIVDALDVRIWQGSTARVLLDALAIERGASGGFAELVANEGGCDAVVRWAASTPAVASVCGNSCVRAACDSTARNLVSTLSELLLALDTERDLLHLEGEIGGLDTDADTLLDTVGPGVLLGTWSTPGGSSADVAGATLSASRR